MSFTLSKILHFPQSTLQYIPQTDSEIGNIKGLPLLGGILSDTRYVWHAKGPCLEIRDTKTGTKIGAWTFGCILKDLNTRIVCVDEIQRLNGRLSLLAVGIHCAISGGLICIFDIFGSKVIRAIQIEEKITNLHVIDSGCEVLNLPGPLRNFDGIVAVGTDGGDVYLVDICRQICEEVQQAAVIRDELCPCQLVILTLKEISRIEDHKEQSVREGHHLALHLNIILDSLTEHFTLKGPKGEDRIYVNREEVIVSSLYYCSQLTSLLVGFNFGAFQLWDLTSLNLVYTSPVCEDHIPVTHFTLQEPADDPRAFCYIWVLYSNTEHFQSGLPYTVMYSFSYESKEYHEGYGYLYQDFQSCSVRFQVELGALSDAKSSLKPKGGYCISLESVCKTPINKDLNSHDSSGDILALCVLSWTVWFSQNDTQTNMLVFDLNQWYKEQMPEFTKWSDCSTYIFKANISDLINNAGKRSGPMIDIKIDKKSIRQFTSVQRLEEHFCPTALSFDLWGLRENDVFQCYNEGLQKALLTHIEVVGPLCLIRPNDVYRQVLYLGLMPLFVECSNNVPTSIETQREIILNVGLEHQLLGWLCKCASEWANGSFSSAGCSLDFLINWAFQRAVLLKTHCDKYCSPLFDYSQTRLDHNTSILLNSFIRQINNLCIFYTYIQNKLHEFISNPEMVMEQHTSLKMVSIYFEVLQWLVNVGLLPECHPSTYPRLNNTDRISAPYPIQQLTKYYNEKRAQLQLLSKETFVNSDSLLFIDNLINNKCGAEKLQNQWQEDGGSGLYPPPSLQSMLRTYLIENADISHKHSLIIYVFLDLAMALDQSRYSSVITHLIKFPAVFKVSSSIIKITQAFWQLDHGDYTTAMEQLLDPFVLSDDLQPWHHAIAMRALLLQNQYNFALLYMQIRKPPITDEKDVLTAISLFIANNMLDEAFYFKNQHQNNNEEKLLMHLFNECNRNESLHVLLYRCLNTNEEKAFFKYLKSVENPTLGDLQVFYYLLRSRFVEAFDAHQNTRKIRPECQGLIGQKNATKSDQIVRIFKTLLPDVNKNLVDVIRRERSNLWKEVPRPTPLSVFVHNTNEQIQYKSTVIHAALAKAKHTFNDLNATKFNEVVTEDTPFLRTPKAIKMGARHATPIINPVVIEYNENGEEISPSPAKRLKLAPRPSTSSPTKSYITSIHSRMLTPIVKRKTSLQKEQSHLTNSNFSVCTPQSILKVRNLVRNNDATSDETFKDDSLYYEGFAKTEHLSKNSSLCLKPRKALQRTPRPHVKFDDITCSSSISDQSIKPPFNSTFVEDPLVEKSILSSREISHLISSKESSSNPDEIFYSPDSSISELTKPQDTDVIVNVPNNVLATENVEKNDEIKLEEVPDTSEDILVSPLVAQYPKARRSYKRALGGSTPIRTSSRLLSINASIQSVENITDISKDSSLPLNKSELFLSNITKEDSILSDINLSKAESSIKQSPRLLQKVKGRKSLSRKVLENNTFSKIAPTLTLNDAVTSKEISYSKLDKTVISEKKVNTVEVTTIENKIEIKDVSVSQPEIHGSSHQSHTVRSSVSKNKIFESSLASDTSTDPNSSYEYPELPESLKMSDSLLEYIQSRKNKVQNVEQHLDDVEKSEKHQDYDEDINDESETPFKETVSTDTGDGTLPEVVHSKSQSENADNTNKQADTPQKELEEQNKSDVDVKPMEVYEDLSSGAEDIEEVLAASKQITNDFKEYAELTNYSENMYDKLETNIFEITESREQSFEDEIVSEKLLSVPENQSRLDTSAVSIVSSVSDINKGFIAEDQTLNVSVQDSEVIEIGTSSEDEESSKSHSESSESNSYAKSDSDVDELNISYERNIHVEENSRSLVDSESSRASAEHDNESELDEDIHERVRIDLIAHDNNSNNEDVVEINEDDNSADWMDNADNSNEHLNIGYVEEVEAVVDAEDKLSEPDEAHAEAEEVMDLEIPEIQGNEFEMEEGKEEEDVVLSKKTQQESTASTEENPGQISELQISAFKDEQIATEENPVQEIVQQESTISPENRFEPDDPVYSKTYELIVPSLESETNKVETEERSSELSEQHEELNQEGDKSKQISNTKLTELNITEDKNTVRTEGSAAETEVFHTQEPMNTNVSETEQNCEIQKAAAKESWINVSETQTKEKNNKSEQTETVKNIIEQMQTEQDVKEVVPSITEEQPDANAKIDNRPTSVQVGKIEMVSQSTNTTVLPSIIEDISCSIQEKITVEQSTNTTTFLHLREKSVLEKDETILETNRPKERRIYHPKYGTMKIIGEDQSASSISSDVTEGEITVQEIVVNAQIHTLSEKHTEAPARRITRRSSALLSQNETDDPNHEKAVSESDSNFGTSELVNDAFTPGKRTRRSQSATYTPTKTIKTRGSSQINIDKNEELNQPSTSKENPKELSIMLRRTRSGSVDEVSTLPKRRSLRSSSVDDRTEDNSQEGKPKAKRGKASSVSHLSVITEMKKEESQSGLKSKRGSVGEGYTINRRLTRHQAHLIKSIETPSSVTAADDSDEEKVLEVDAIDPIKLLDKEPFQGVPDPEEEKIYSPSSPSNSTTSSFNKPARRASRSASMASDSSLPPSASQTSTPKRKTRQSVGHFESPTGIKARLRRQSETSSIASEKSDPPTPPKRARRRSQNADESGSAISIPVSTRSTRSKANSVSSNKSESSASAKKSTRSKRLVSAKSDLPEIEEEKGSEKGTSHERNSKGQVRRVLKDK